MEYLIVYHIFIIKTFKDLNDKINRNNRSKRKLKPSNVKITAIIVTIIFVGMICFQMLLALGFPLGYAAWGGEYETLPTELRFASLITVFIFVIASLLVLARAEIIGNLNKPKFVKYGVLIFAVFFAFNTVMNLLSSNILENLIMTQ